MIGPIKVVFDSAAISAAFAAVIGLLPPIAAGLSILWLLWQMYDRAKYGPRRGAR